MEDVKNYIINNYHDLYLKDDVLLSADMFVNFRNNLEIYNNWKWHCWVNNKNKAKKLYQENKETNQ